MASFVPSWVPVGSLHHVGYIVPSINGVAESFCESIGANWDRVVIHDPLQQVFVSFLQSRVPNDPLIELVEPASANSPVTSFLEHGGGLHHICYQVNSLEKQLELSRKAGGFIVRSPLPAVAFGGRRIAWVYTKSKLLIEYLEC
jgi:methylmalonyl-CoA/ethylmalonyl-CoA epimerase